MEDVSFMCVAKSIVHSSCYKPARTEGGIRSHAAPSLQVSRPPMSLHLRISLHRIRTELGRGREIVSRIEAPKAL